MLGRGGRLPWAADCPNRSQQRLGYVLKKQLEGPGSGAVILATSLCPPVIGVLVKAEGPNHGVEFEEGVGKVRVTKGLMASFKL